MQHSGNVRQEVCAYVELSGNPYECERETVLDLQVEQMYSQTLKVGVGGAPRHKLAPRTASRGECGDDAAHDEDTTEVVHHHFMTPATQEVRHGRDGEVDAIELVQGRAGAQQVLRQRGHEFDAAACAAADRAPGEARGG